MIENFTPQPYPLECFAGSWSLVIGWRQLPDGRLAPVVAPADGPLTLVANPDELHYRVPGTTRHAPQVEAIAETVRPEREPRRSRSA